MRYSTARVPTAFDGSCKTSAEDILTRMEARMKVTNFSDDELLLAMPVLLQGVPFKWFKNHELKFAN